MSGLDTNPSTFPSKQELEGMRVADLKMMIADRRSPMMAKSGRERSFWF
jgi:hypothetical protein